MNHGDAAQTPAFPTIETDERRKAAHGVTAAYRDAEGWILYGEDSEPMNWPMGWPTFVDKAFLRSQGVVVFEG